MKVLEEGEVEAGDSIVRAGKESVRTSFHDMMLLLSFEPENVANAKSALEIKVPSSGWRRLLKERVAKAANRPGVLAVRR